MPTIITHAFVGTAAGSVWNSTVRTATFWVLSILLPMLPDVDVLMFRLGIPYEHWLGHRGLFHSLLFALVVALIVTSVFFREPPRFSKGWFVLAGYFFALIASHDLLDAMTNGGLGIALLAPFDNTRYFLPWRPIAVSPIGLSNFFGAWGARVMLNELLWVWLPVGGTVLLLKTALKRR